MKEYKYVVFDADDTLLDYRADEKDAFLRTFAALGIRADEETLHFANETSENVWTSVGLYDVTNVVVQERYHALYREHVRELFEQIKTYLKARGVQATFNATDGGKLFLRELATGKHYKDGAIDVLRELKSRGYVLYIATNGLSDIQRGRLKRLAAYVNGLFISEETGAIKPTKAFFEKMLQAGGICREECLFVGDSLTSDIGGANASGIDSCFYNAKRVRVSETSPQPTYTVEKLSEILSLLA